eukprot:7685754-Pyramimonas_sp.AAC.1
MNVQFFEKWLQKLSLSSLSTHAWKELYEVPGGDQVDGLPPAPVPRRALRHRLAPAVNRQP